MSETGLRLPQQDGGWFLTDAGLETVLIFQEGIALPEFAAFVLLESERGPRELAPLLPALSRAGGRDAWSRLHPREPDVARRLRLGREARVRRRSDAAHQPRRDRADAGASVGVRAAHRAADRRQRLRGAARRRLRRRRADGARRCRARASTAGRGVGRRGRRPDHGHYDDDERRSDRCRARRRASRPPVGHLVHRRNRRQAAERRVDRGRDRRRRCGRRRSGARGAGLLHAELRASVALRARARRARRSPRSGCAGCGPTHRAAATRSSTRRRSSTPATRRSSARTTRGSRRPGRP